MTTTAPAATPTSTAAGQSRLGAWLLTLSPLSYLVVILASFPIVLSLLPGLPLLDDVTRAQMDVFAPGWIAMNVLQLLAGIGTVGVLMVAIGAEGRGGGWAKASAVVAAIGLLALVAGIGLRLAATGFTGDRLADDARYAIGTVLMASMTAPMIATVLLCAALRLSGRLRISAIIIGSLALVYAVLDVVSYATGIALPPVLATLTTWMPLGIVLLLQSRRERRTGPSRDRA